VTALEATAADVGPEARFQRALAEGRLEIPRCDACGRVHFHPRVVCPYCGSTRLSWSPADGTGVIYSATVNRAREGDRSVVLVDLVEGVRMMSTVVDTPPDAVRIGDRVTLAVDRRGSAPLVVARVVR
jgi:uncharacterized OB-fold protein